MMSYEAANEWLKKRRNLPTELSSRGISQELAQRVRSQSFFSARVAEARILEKLRQVSDRYSRGEIDLASARAELKTFLGEKYDPRDPADRRLQNLASTARLDLILEQNAAMAAAVGRYQEGMDSDVRERWPYWRYCSRDDGRVRADHATYSGRIYAKDDPIWHRIFPPRDFRCRCWVEDVGEEEAQAAGVSVGGRLPDLPESGFAFDPADAFDFNVSDLDGNIRDLVGEQLELRFPEQAEPEPEEEKKQYRYTPGKTVKEVEANIKKADLADALDLKGIKNNAVPVVNEAMQALTGQLNAFPEIRVDMEAIGATQNVESTWYKRAVDDVARRLRERGVPENIAQQRARQVVKRPRTPTGVLAVSTKDPAFGTSGITINKVWLQNPDRLVEILKRDTEAGHFVKGGGSVKAMIDHEFGHMLDYHYNLRNNPAIMAIMREAENVEEELSMYGSSSPAEFIAEAWSEYCNNPKPRKIAKKIGETIEKIAGKR